MKLTLKTMSCLTDGSLKVGGMVSKEDAAEALGYMHKVGDFKVGIGNDATLERVMYLLQVVQNLLQTRSVAPEAAPKRTIEESVAEEVAGGVDILDHIRVG